jgi:hypothetical protein
MTTDLKITKDNYEPGMLKNYPNLKSLWVAMYVIETDDLKYTPNLLHLFIPCCDNIDLPTALGYLPNLTHLDISACNLDDVDDDLFTRTPNLEYLSMTDSQGETLTNELFKPLTKLKTLNLQSCRIDNVDDGAFKYLQNLENLDISNCYFSAGIFEYLKKLEYLTIEGNAEDVINAYQDMCKARGDDM